MKAALAGSCLAAYLCCGCSLTGGDKEPTIASLGKRPLHLKDVQIHSDEQLAMSAYSEYLETADDSTARPLAMRRIADLNLEAEPLARTDASIPSEAVRAADSIKLYRQVLELYPERSDNDMVLYQLARAYEHNGQPEASLATLARLVHDYPESSHTLEAQFRRGEILFVQQDYRAAEQAYSAVIAAGDGSPFYRQSLYKSGWCYFKQSLFSEALDNFIALLDLELQGTTSSGDRLARLEPARRELVTDTLRVTSLSFSYENGADTIALYFSRHSAREYESLFYESLGQLYLQQERYSDAARTFQTFVDLHPVHGEAPRFQMRVIETYEQGGFPTLVLQAKQDFVNRYQLQGNYWLHHDSRDSAQVLEFLKLTMTDLSRHYHAQSQRTHKQEDYDQAIHWYRSFLGSFPDAGEAPQMHFLLAELLFESGNFQDATLEYVHTAYDYGGHAMAAEAGYAAVLAYARAEEQLAAASRTAWHRQSIENALRFATTFPQHPEALEIRTRTAEQLLAIEEPERAIVVAQSVTADEAATLKQQRVAWSVQAHANYDSGDYLQAEQACQQVRSRSAGDAEEKEIITELLAASIYKQGEAAMMAGDTTAAVAHFARVRQTTPSATIVATAEYDAAAGLLHLQAWSDAAVILQRLRAEYPNDPRQAEITRRLATAYLSAHQSQQAAAEFERIGRGSGTAEIRREALWQAAELHAQAGQPEHAIEVYRYYVGQFPHPAETVIEASQHIVELYNTLGDSASQQHWLTKIIGIDRQAGNERTDRTRYLAAQAAFQLAESSYQAYLGVALRLPLKQSLARKKQLMETALRRYEQAGAYQVAIFTTAATCRTAEIYTHMGESLLRSERPAGLSSEALAEYDMLLEEQAYPFEEQGISLHEANIQRIESGLYDAWIGRSQTTLATLVPGRYAKLERSATYVQAIH